MKLPRTYLLRHLRYHLFPDRAVASRGTVATSEVIWAAGGASGDWGVWWSRDVYKVKMAPTQLSDHQPHVGPHPQTQTAVYTHTATADEWAAQRPAHTHTHTHQMMGIGLMGHENTQLLGYRLILC